MMLKKMLNVWKTICLTAVLLVAAPGLALADSPMNVQISPDIIQTSASFPGAQVKLTGQVPAGSQVFVKLLAQGGSVSLAEKGRQGIFWLNKRTVHVSGLPAFYMVFTSANIAGLPAGVQQEMGLYGNFSELLRSAVVTTNTGLSPAESARYAQALIDVNKQKGLYQERAADFDPAANGSFSYRFLLPKDLPAGQIQVLAWAVKDGRVVATSQNGLSVQRVGLGGYLSTMAQNQAALYGVMALLAAVLAGVGINFLFGGIEAATKSIFRRKLPVVAGREGEKKVAHQARA
ncbi:MAG TPA: TIGR02186 family protein [Spirochaetia bacterium]|nr:TIGR02186 family protein [Spirochaetia bacterium]